MATHAASAAEKKRSKSTTKSRGGAPLPSEWFSQTLKSSAPAVTRKKTARSGSPVTEEPKGGSPNEREHHVQAKRQAQGRKDEEVLKPVLEAKPVIKPSTSYRPRNTILHRYGTE